MDSNSSIHWGQHTKYRNSQPWIRHDEKGKAYCRVCDKRTHCKPLSECPEGHKNNYARYRKYSKSMQKKAYWSRDPETNKKFHRFYHLTRNYGITPDMYDQMLKSQGGTCALCDATSGTRKNQTSPFHIDHNHKTGKIRGLLCNRCNYVVGIIESEPTLFLWIMDYLGDTDRYLDLRGEIAQNIDKFMPFARSGKK